MITIGEEILLLLLDYDSGWMNASLPTGSRTSAISGAILMDLAVNNRIDTDPERLFVLDPSPLDEPPLDRALKRIASEDRKQAIDYWIRELSDDHPALEELLVERLVTRGVLFRGQYDKLWVMGGRHRVAEGGAPLPDVRRRIARELSDETIPDPRDIMIISLADACELWHVLISEADRARLAPKIKQIAGMDLIGQAVVRAIQQPHARPSRSCARGPAP